MTSTKTTIITGTAAELINYVRNSPDAEEIREMINVCGFERELLRIVQPSDILGAVICDAAFSNGPGYACFELRIHGADWPLSGVADIIDEEELE